MAAKKKKGGGDLLTLTEVSNRTGISMPTLQRYKKLYQARIPSEGQGRKQRYPEEALEVFEEIKQENIGRRGRPRKDGTSGTKKTGAKKTTARKTSSGRKTGAKKTASRKSASKKKTTRKTGTKKASGSSKSTSGLLTLAEIGRRTGISYPTLSRYVKQYGEQLKSEGEGRARRFYEEAVSVFEEIRGRSGRGRKAGSGTKGRKAAKGRKATSSGSSRSGGDADLKKRVAALEKQLKALERKLSKPVRFKVLSS